MIKFYFQKLPWNWFPGFHEFFGLDFLAHRTVQISTVCLHFRNTMLDWSSITSRFTIGWWITSLNSHWAPSTYEFSYEWLIEKKSVAAVTIMEWLKVLLIIGSRENKTKKNLLQRQKKIRFKKKNRIMI